MAAAGPALTYRAAAAGDLDWLYALHRATMRDYVASVYGWDEADQRRRFETGFAPGALQVIQVGGRDAGLLEVQPAGGYLFLARLELDPAVQRQGLGTQVVRAVLARAAAAGLRVRLQVLRPNPARALYERLGFRLCGTTPTHHQLEADPARERPGA